MFSNPIKSAAMALAASGLAFATPASAAVPAHAPAGTHAPVYGDLSYDHGKKRGHYKKRGKYKHRYDDHRRYSRGYYGDPVYADTRIWRGRDGRYYCRKRNGTTGLLIGAAVGGLVGHEVAGRGDRTLGAIIGAAGGAILGRAIDRSNARCR